LIKAVAEDCTCQILRVERRVIITQSHLLDIESSDTSRLTNDLMVTARLASI
jgi:hypothetical protein